MTSLAATLASLLLAMQAQPAERVAVSASQDEPAEKAKDKDDKDKVICKRTAVIGSKFKKKICATQEEWETLRAQSAEETRSMQRRKGVEPVS